MPNHNPETARVRAARMLRICTQTALVVMVATVAHAAPTADDCPCRRAQAADVAARVAPVTHPSLVALDATPGSGFVMTSAGGAGRPEVPPITAGRVAGETAAALAAGAVGGIVAASVAWGAGYNCTNEECTTGVIAGAFAAYSTIIALAVTGAGRYGDQHVPFTYPFLGALAGGAMGCVLFLRHGPVDSSEWIGLGLFLPPTGAVIGAIAGRRWDAAPARSLRLLSPPTTPSAWNGETAPGPLPGAQFTVASLAF